MEDKNLNRRKYLDKSGKLIEKRNKAFFITITGSICVITGSIITILWCPLVGLPISFFFLPFVLTGTILQRSYEKKMDELNKMILDKKRT